MRRRLTKEKQLEIENAALREAIESALADLADDKCNASIRIMSAKFTLAGANKLGRYEDLGSPEELEEMVKKLKK